MGAVLLVLVLVLAGCTFPQDVPSPEAPPPAPVTEAPPPPAPVAPLPPTAQLITFAPPERVVVPVVDPPPARQTKPVPVVTPARVVQDAQKAAEVEPTPRGFHGQSATHRWIWQPGKLYVVYVSPNQMTKIVLPPGEALVSKVFLDPELWDVQSYRVGNETVQQDVVFVRPLAEKNVKDVDLALLSEQGHSYDIHLKVGVIGMFAVTWDTPSLPQLLIEEPQLRSQP